MKLISLILIVVGITSAENQKAEEVQKKAYQAFDVQFKTYQIMHDQYKNVVLWVYPDDTPDVVETLKDKYQEAIKHVINGKVDTTEVIFAKGEASHFMAENPQYFKQHGIYVTSHEQVYYQKFDQNEDFDKLKQWILDLVQPDIMQYLEKSEVEEYMKAQDSVKMLMILEEKHPQYKEIKQLFLDLMRTHALRKSGMEHFHWYLGDSYLEYTQPALLVKNRARAIQEYNGNITKESEIVEFLKQVSLPPLVALDESNLERVFTCGIKAQIHMLIDPAQNNEELLRWYQKLAFENSNGPKEQRLIFTYSSFDDNPEFWEQIGLGETFQVPTVVITELIDDEYFANKYFYKEEEFNIQGVKRLIKNFQDQTIVPQVLSEPLENSKQEGIFKKIVSSNFVEEIVNNDKYVFVLFYHSKYSESYYDKYANLFEQGWNFTTEESKQFFKLVKIDLNMNEIPKLRVKQAPSYRIYMANNKSQYNDFPFVLDKTQVYFWHQQVCKPCSFFTYDVIESELATQKRKEFFPPGIENEEEIQTEQTTDNQQQQQNLDDGSDEHQAQQLTEDL